MRTIKYIKFWWAYNADKKEPSSLFYLVNILLFPFIFIYVMWEFHTDEELKKVESEYTKFRKAWKKHKENIVER